MPPTNKEAIPVEAPTVPKTDDLPVMVDATDDEIKALTAGKGSGVQPSRLLVLVKAAMDDTPKVKTIPVSDAWPASTIKTHLKKGAAELKVKVRIYDRSKETPARISFKVLPLTDTTTDTNAEPETEADALAANSELAQK